MDGNDWDRLVWSKKSTIRGAIGAQRENCYRTYGLINYSVKDASRQIKPLIETALAAVLKQHDFDIRENYWYSTNHLNPTTDNRYLSNYHKVVNEMLITRVMTLKQLDNPRSRLLCIGDKFVQNSCCEIHNTDDIMTWLFFGHYE